MHEIRTQVDISAGAALVWLVLTDFNAYPLWNPFIIRARGDLEKGGTISIAERLSGGGLGTAPSPTHTTVSTLRHIREPRQLSWFSRWRMTWLFGAERRFQIESLPEGGVRFRQDERFDGLLAPLMWRRLARERGPAFDRMNRALKARAERAAAGAPRTVL